MDWLVILAALVAFGVAIAAYYLTQLKTNTHRDKRQAVDDEDSSTSKKAKRHNQIPRSKCSVHFIRATEPGK